MRTVPEAGRGHLRLTSRAFCWLLGHRPGPELFRYIYPPRNMRKHWIDRCYTMGVVGYECARCGAMVIE